MKNLIKLVSSTYNLHEHIHLQICIYTCTHNTHVHPHHKTSWQVRLLISPERRCQYVYMDGQKGGNGDVYQCRAICNSVSSPVAEGPRSQSHQLSSGSCVVQQVHGWTEESSCVGTMPNIAYRTKSWKLCRYIRILLSFWCCNHQCSHSSEQLFVPRMSSRMWNSIDNSWHESSWVITAVLSSWSQAIPDYHTSFTPLSNKDSRWITQEKFQARKVSTLQCKSQA